MYAVTFDHFGIDVTGPEGGMWMLPMAVLLGFPIGREWFRDGKDWTTLEEPLRLRFCLTLNRYLVALWTLSAAGLVALISYAKGWLGFSYSIGVLATLLVLTGAATLVVARRLHAIRRDDWPGTALPSVESRSD